MPNFDLAYTSILNECDGNLVPFLDSIFGFLYRNSDFFQSKNSSESVVGFHPGQNKSLLLAVFNKWNKYAEDERTTKEKLALSDVPLAVREEEVTSAVDSPGFDKANHVKVEDDPVNGANYGHYRWSQTPTELEITIPVQDMVKRGKDVDITCTSGCLKVSEKVSNMEVGQVLLEGEFTHPVKASEMVWNLMPGSHILVTLEKGSGHAALWPKLFKSEDKAVALNYNDDQLNESDRMACEYAMHKQSSKKQEDEKLKDVLKAAWNQEGSPFQGQPFDPNVISNIK